jgi:hypothetical protein
LKIPKISAFADSKKSHEKKTKQNKNSKFKMATEVSEEVQKMFQALIKSQQALMQGQADQSRIFTDIQLQIKKSNERFSEINKKNSNLTTRVEKIEKNPKVEESIVTQEELGEILRRKNELVIFGLPELDAQNVCQNDLKNEVLTELNKVTQTTLEEIKYVKKFGKPNGKIRPTLVVLNGAAKRDRIIEEARRVSPNIQPNLTKQQQQFKKKLKDEIKEKNSKAGHIICKIAGPSDAPFIQPTKEQGGGFHKVMQQTTNTSKTKQKSSSGVKSLG